MSLVRALAHRYLLVLFAVAVLVMVDQAIIQPLLVRLNFYAPAINVAGRQRMLSQKVTKESLALATGSVAEEADFHRAQLSIALDEWTKAHHGLLEGNRELGLRPISDPSTIAGLRAIEPRLLAIQAAARQIAAPEASWAGPSAASVAGTALDTILSEEPAYLRGMERVVGMLEVSAGRQVDFLRWCGVAAMSTVLVLLVGVYFVVLRPAIGLIRNQIAQLASSDLRHREMTVLLTKARDELESRVAERTGELVRANGALEREMAEREVVETRMRQLSAELAHASRVTALGQLATGLAHEINQPLASIANYADVLDLAAADGTLEPAQARSTIAELKQAALRAGGIVRRMRNFVRSGSGASSEVELNALVREVCELCRPQLRQAHVQLLLELSETDRSVTADPIEIQQVLVNLVQNAAQALAEFPRETRQIQISTYILADRAVVEVADTGPGFPTDFADDSFAPFFSTKREGLGMGLAISRAIVDRHQGRLWGENRAAGGALVSFCLPLSLTHDSTAHAPADCFCR